MKTFLICHTGALGDFVLTWPVIAALRKTFPDHAFLGIGHPEKMRLAVKLGLVDRFLDADSAALIPFFADGILPETVGHPDGGVLWMKDAEPILQTLRRRASLSVIAISPFDDQSRHVAATYAEAVQSYFPITVRFLFQVWRSKTRNSENLILIHPGSGGLKKVFPPDFYMRIADLIRSSLNCDVRFILGPAEIERGIADAFPSKQIMRPSDVSELADLLIQSRLLIGNDSGVSHLAGALGVPVIAFYKATDPKIWGVTGERVVMIHQADADAAFADFREVFEGWRRDMEFPQVIYERERIRFSEKHPAKTGDCFG